MYTLRNMARYKSVNEIPAQWSHDLKTFKWVRYLSRIQLSGWCLQERLGAPLTTWGWSKAAPKLEHSTFHLLWASSPKKSWKKKSYDRQENEWPSSQCWTVHDSSLISAYQETQWAKNSEVPVFFFFSQSSHTLVVKALSYSDVYDTHTGLLYYLYSSLYFHLAMYTKFRHLFISLAKTRILHCACLYKANLACFFFLFPSLFLPFCFLST